MRIMLFYLADLVSNHAKTAVSGVDELCAKMSKIESVKRVTGWSVSLRDETGFDKRYSQWTDVWHCFSLLSD